VVVLNMFRLQKARIPKRGILGNGSSNLLKSYIFYRMPILHVALYVLFVLSLPKG